VTLGGQPIGFTESVLRNLLRAADGLPFGQLGIAWPSYAIALVVMGKDKKFRRLGDLVAGTMVVVEDRRVVADRLRIDPPPSPQELAYLPQRLPLSGEELEALELFLRREGRLGPAREDELASMVAPIFAKRLGVRYRDPTRFLKVLYARARGIGPEDPHQQRRGMYPPSHPNMPGHPPPNQPHPDAQWMPRGPR
jgi:hypothetical protein